MRDLKGLTITVKEFVLFSNVIFEILFLNQKRLLCIVNLDYFLIVVVALYSLFFTIFFNVLG